MSQNSVVGLSKPEETCQDALTEVLRNKARKMLMAALEAEVEAFLQQHQQVVDAKKATGGAQWLSSGEGDSDWLGSDRSEGAKSEG